MNKNLTHKKEIAKWLTAHHIKRYDINADLSVDVFENINLLHAKLDFLPIQFNFVSGNFLCSNNFLTSLQGSPVTVGGDFNCEKNKLTSLFGAPKMVGQNFICSSNLLTSLEYAPEKVGATMACDNNQLTSLEHCSAYIGGSLWCYSNQLQSLEYCPRFVGREVECSRNPLLGAAQEIEDFDEMKKIHAEHRAIKKEKEKLEKSVPVNTSPVVSRNKI